MNLRAAFFTLHPLTKFKIIQGRRTRRGYLIASDSKDDGFTRSSQAEGEDGCPGRRTAGWKWHDASPCLPSTVRRIHSFKLDIVGEH